MQEEYNLNDLMLMLDDADEMSHMLGLNLGFAMPGYHSSQLFREDDVLKADKDSLAKQIKEHVERYKIDAEFHVAFTFTPQSGQLKKYQDRIFFLVYKFSYYSNRFLWDKNTGYVMDR